MLATACPARGGPGVSKPLNELERPEPRGRCRDTATKCCSRAASSRGRQKSGHLIGRLHLTSCRWLCADYICYVESIQPASQYQAPRIASRALTSTGFPGIAPAIIAGPQSIGVPDRVHNFARECAACAGERPDYTDPDGARCRQRCGHGRDARRRSVSHFFGLGFWIMHVSHNFLWTIRSNWY